MESETTPTQDTNTLGQTNTSTTESSQSVSTDLVLEETPQSTEEHVQASSEAIVAEGNKGDGENVGATDPEQASVANETEVYHGPTYSTKHPVQELNELRGNDIEYTLDKEFPRDGLWVFTMSVEIEGTRFVGEGKSKKQAKAEAAKNALLKLYNIFSIESNKNTSNWWDNQAYYYGNYTWDGTSYDYYNYYYGYYDYNYSADYDWGYEKPPLESHFVDYQIGVKYNRYGEAIGEFDAPEKAQYCCQNPVQMLYQYHPEVKFEAVDEYVEDNEKMFILGCLIKRGYFKGFGKTKKEAKSDCATTALAVMHNIHIVPVGKKTIKGSFRDKESTRMIKTPLRDLYEIRPHLEFFCIDVEEMEEDTLYTYAVEMDEVLYEGEGFDPWGAKQAAAYRCLEALKCYLNPDYEKEKLEAKAKEQEVKEYKREKAKAKAKARQEKEDQQTKKLKLQEDEDEEKKYWDTIAKLKGANLQVATTTQNGTYSMSDASSSSMAYMGSNLEYSSAMMNQNYYSGYNYNQTYDTYMNYNQAYSNFSSGMSGSNGYSTDMNQAYSAYFSNMSSSQPPYSSETVNSQTNTQGMSSNQTYTTDTSNTAAYSTGITNQSYATSTSNQTSNTDTSNQAYDTDTKNQTYSSDSSNTKVYSSPATSYRTHTSSTTEENNSQTCGVYATGITS